VAPLVLLPNPVTGDADPVRIAAAFATIVVGWWRKGMLPSVIAGVITYGGLQYLL